MPRNVRNYYDNSDTQTWKEWVICPYDNKSGPLSDKGDSRPGICHEFTPHLHASH